MIELARRTATEEEIAEERRKSDEFVNQPCYDADGVPILPGETVYSSTCRFQRAMQDFGSRRCHA